MKKSALRFTWIRLENWRNFRSVEADLGPRVFLVGPNASGKSNFLDAFRFLRDIASDGGGLQEAVRRRGGVSALRYLGAPKRAEITVHVAVGNGKESRAWEYAISFHEAKGPESRVAVRSERVVKQGHLLLSRPSGEDIQDSQRLTQTHLEQVTVNREFRDLARFFADVRYLHIVPQLVREPERYLGKRDDPYGGDFLKQLAREPEDARQTRLERIAKVLRIAVPHLQDIRFDVNDRGTPHLRARHAHWREEVGQTEAHLSDGTLRLLGMLWIMLSEGGPVLLEEPELSLHPGVVRQLPQAMARLGRRTGRQILLSTHSLDLLRDEGIGLDEVLLLVPGREGTVVRSPKDMDQVRALLEGGLPLGDAVLPYTSPEDADQLPSLLDR